MRVFVSESLVRKTNSRFRGLDELRLQRSSTSVFDAANGELDDVCMRDHFAEIALQYHATNFLVSIRVQTLFN